MKHLLKKEKASKWLPYWGSQALKQHSGVPWSPIRVKLTQNHHQSKLTKLRTRPLRIPSIRRPVVRVRGTLHMASDPLKEPSCFLIPTLVWYLFFPNFPAAGEIQVSPSLQQPLGLFVLFNIFGPIVSQVPISCGRSTRCEYVFASLTV